MADIQEALADPFSRENAWLAFQKNREEALRLREMIRQEQETGTATERERLIQAADALGRLTDNSVLRPAVEKSLAERAAK